MREDFWAATLGLYHLQQHHPRGWRQKHLRGADAHTNATKNTAAALPDVIRWFKTQATASTPWIIWKKI
ncbi:MAG: hypothetical protein ACLR7U_07275 [Ruthenibacterium lactatiformans]